MNIAVSAAGPGLDQAFEPRFGRAKGFVLLDSPNGEPGYIENKARGLAQGAGIQTAQMLADQGVETLITGALGPNAEQALAQSGIKVLTCQADTVSKALACLDEQPQQPAAGPGSPTGPGRGVAAGGRGMGGGARGRGPGQGGRGMGGGAQGRGPGQGGRGQGGGRGRV